VSLVFLAVAVLLLVVQQLMDSDEDRGSRMTVVPTPEQSAAPTLPAAAGVTTAAGLSARPSTAGTGPVVSLAPADTAAGLPGMAPTVSQAAPVWADVGAADTGFTFAGGFGPVLGSTGTIRQFKVAVQTGIGQGDGRDFATVVDRILGDSRSWIAGRQFRLQRVPQPATAEFTIYLASAGTSERICAQGGLRTDGFTSCRLSGRVIINVDRWAGAVPGYGAPLDVYRSYAINHEVGHQLGHGHEACPGSGRPAPVMMQQTYGLKGCVAYSWPYLDGRRYSGAPVA